MKFKPTTNLIVLFLSLIAVPCMAQKTPEHKQIAAKRTTASIKLDGLIDDAAWKDAPAALGYTEFRPTPFRKEDEANRTEVYMLYNNEGIYFGGYCHERTKDSISTELGGRDGFGNNDFIGAAFDTYNDKINGFEYFITPLGEQMDAKISPSQNGNNEDFSWNAVWKSAAVIHNDGWSFEMFIPLSAIRFSKEKVQTWGLNIFRRRQKTGQTVSWNTLDVNVNGSLTQAGLWTGLENIKPPLRLQFTPYFSTYANHYPLNQKGQKNWTSQVNGGMDVKYGISQAITLDMTLIPDFGQVKSDNTILNLGPFETKYEDNRSFFTEGTELFNKGNLFYSRRVGGRPLNYYNAYESSSDTVLSNPQTSKLVNATKISGRLKGGLGVGFFNAVSERTFAVVENKNTKEQRKIETSPLTNYNILVLDQTLKNNSSVSLINTNVLRNGKDYDANATAILFDLNDKKNTWNLGGKAATSNLFNYLPGGKTKSGYTGSVYIGKTSGRFNFQLNETITDDKYQINDMGYFTNNNYWEQSLWSGYNWTKPSKWYNRLNLNLNLGYFRRLKSPSMYTGANFNFNVNGQLKNLWHVGLFTGYEPSGNDFYETHKEGSFFKGWKSFFGGVFFETNNAKKYFINAEVFYVSRSLFHSNKYSLSLRQRYRFNDKLSVRYGLSLDPQKRNVGFADFMGDDIIFGKRDINTVENSFSIKYNFNKKMGLNVDIRHYWSKVDYRDPAINFFKLKADGTLEHTAAYTGNANQNYNAFNVDATYTWEFAPGSFINIVWKNSNPVDNFNQVTKDGYFTNLNNTLNHEHNNNISFKILYFLDYLQLKGHKKKDKK
jgi:hypothetical protein